METVQTTTRRPGIARLGALAWVLGAIQFFVCQLIAQSAWTTPYSWSLNTVSDLGNITCQPWGDDARYVCSPLHDLMNASVVVEGLVIIVGMILIASLWRPAAISRAARTLLIIAGMAIITAGLAPADVNENLHVVGGAVPITVFGNCGLILAGLATDARRLGRMRILGPVIGVTGLVATELLFSRHYLGLGMGGMERFAVFSLPIWTLLTGIYLLAKPDRSVGR